MNLPEKSDNLLTDNVLVRIAGERQSVSCTLHGTRRREAADHATVAAAFATSERQLAAFVRDQIDGRDPVVEVAMAAAYPEHAEDTAYKITLFGLGLLYMRPELASRLREALRQGNCSVDVQIHAQDVHVHLVAAPHDYETAYVLCDQSGVPAQVH